jgi:hypothetical protein
MKRLPGHWESERVPDHAMSRDQGIIWILSSPTIDDQWKMAGIIQATMNGSEISFISYGKEMII